MLLSDYWWLVWICLCGVVSGCLLRLWLFTTVCCFTGAYLCGFGWRFGLVGFVVVVLVVVWWFVYRFGVDCCFLAVFVVAVVLCWLVCYCLVGAT